MKSLRFNVVTNVRFIAGLLLCVCVAGLPARAQLVLEEVVVTAQKREQNLQDVGISVTAFSGDQIRELGYTNTIDIAQQTPALNVIQFHPTLTTMVIRGISQNDFADHLEAPIAMYVDEAYVSAMGAGHAQLFDIERVEVLRGPQGTLFGRNATGGLIHVISRKPTEEFEGYGEFTYGSYNQTKWEGALSGPLTQNLLGRVSFAGNFHDGVAENRIGPDPRESEAYALRGQLEFRATDDFTLNLKAHYSQDDSLGNAYTSTPIRTNEDGLGVRLGPNEPSPGRPDWGIPYGAVCAGCDINGFRDPDDDPFTGSYDHTGEFRRGIAGFTGKMTLDVGEATTLTLIADYLQMNKNYSEDTDGTPNPYFIYYTDQDFEQTSYEFRVNSAAGDSLRWTGGLYYLDIEHAGNRSVDIEFPFGLSYEGTATDAVETDSWAAFGHVEYDFNENWSVIGALRYTADDKNIDFTGSDFYFGFPGPSYALAHDPDPNTELFDQEYENVSAKFEIDWRPFEDTLVFVSFNRGHKAGSARTSAAGWPEGIFNGLQPLPTWVHDEEVLHSWEGGVKTTFWNGRARLNANVFYYDYKDYQAYFTVPVPPELRGLGSIAALTITNLDAEAVGSEIELSLSPSEGWDFRFGVSLMDSEVKDVILPSGRLIDSDLPYAPAFAMNGLARYAWPALGGTMALQGDFSYSDNFCFTVLCGPIDEEGSYVIGNFRATYTSGDERWRLAAFVHNVSDTEYRIYSLDINALTIANDAFANPRWAGGTISFNWQ